MDKDSTEYLTIQEGEWVIKRVLKTVGGVPVSFFDIFDLGDRITFSVATREGYRGNGYGSEVTRRGLRWLQQHPEVTNGRRIIWGDVREDNAASIAIARRSGFVENSDRRSNGRIEYVMR